MTRYRVLRDFGSHLGNHYRGQYITLPDGALPRGFDGFVERVADPARKDILPASERADDAPPDAGSTGAHYDDKMLRSTKNRRRP